MHHPLVDVGSRRRAYARDLCDSHVVRLRRSKLGGPGLRRVRRGKGWSYRDDDGRPVDEETKERIDSLVIPPAWKDVWICPHPNGHIQAVGTDDAGRRQYLYHPVWREIRDRAKHERVQELVPLLPEMRRRVRRDLREEGLPRERVIAVALRMLDLGLFRTGGEEYEQEHGTHGVTTLYRKHVTVEGERVHFRFPAKSGVQRDATVKDPALAQAIRALKESRAPGKRLLQYRDGQHWREVTGTDVNTEFKALTGSNFTVKDLRTWAATVTAATALAALSVENGQDPKAVAEARKRAADKKSRPPTPSKTAAVRTERQVVKLVSEQLGNTPAVARRSYVDPVVFEKHSSGRTLATTGRLFRRLSRADRKRALAGQPLSPIGRVVVEKAVLKLLRGD
jgi:DNA topoisomerase I